MTIHRPEAFSRLEGMHDPFFVHRVRVSNQLAHVPRPQLFGELLKGKRVLHVGYADWPITDVNANLHVQLDRVCESLDGVDPHEEAGSLLRNHVKGELFRSLDEVTGSYDVLLVPEVIEHVGDLQSFFRDLDRIDFETAVITAPDAFSCMARHFDLVGEPGLETMVEVVHPDHNCWFTPYTLRNVVTKYTPWTVSDPLYFINGISLLLVATREVAYRTSD